jgi:chaperone modulatory protein CbpM
VTERVRAGLIDVQAGPLAAWRFDALVVRRVRSMRRIEHAFDAAPELAALVADLEDEVARLRRRLAILE